MCLVGVQSLLINCDEQNLPVLIHTDVISGIIYFSLVFFFSCVNTKDFLEFRPYIIQEKTL